ncbi:MAG: hypothetical protein KAG04_00240 [Mycoplasmataceae bacterium]|nr:hypothetical protein [Mycoplasmataceae bacterium]
MDKLILIDGNSLTYRAYFASAFSPAGILTTKDGTAVNAVLTLNMMFNKLFREYKPTHILVAFDAGKKTFRHKKLESYKGGRNKTPSELIAQFPIVKEMLDKWGIKHFEVNEIEADDIIATLAKKHSKDIQVSVVSSDKDLFQLVQKNIEIIVPQNGSKPNKILDTSNFVETQGYRPDQVIDIKGLVGDPSDNLPGVKGIGEKGAIKLLSKYDTLEGVYENIEEQTPNLKNKLNESKEIAFLCKEIATLFYEVEVPFSLSDMEFTGQINQELIAFFKKYELNSLVRRFESKITDKKDEENSQMSFDNLML